MTDMLPPGTDKCQCPTCKEYFNSTAAFNRHRYGPYVRGSRRCMTPSELEAKGWTKNTTGHWITGLRPRSTLPAR